MSFSPMTQCPKCKMWLHAGVTKCSQCAAMAKYPERYPKFNKEPK